MNFFRKKQKESTEINIATGAGYQNIMPFGTNPFYNSAFWACVINLARQYATLPLHAYRKDVSGVIHELPHDSYYSKLMNHPNRYMDGYTFRFIMGINFELHGQAVAILERASNGFVKALYPVSPNTIFATIGSNSEIIYTLGASGVKYRAQDLLIINNTPDGYCSVLKPIQYVKSDVELVAASKKMQREYYDGSSVMGNLVKVPDGWQAEKREQVKAAFDSANGYRNIVLSNSVTVEPIHVAAGDIGKLIEAQGWADKEIAKRFQVPPFFIGDTSATYSSAEHQGQQMITYCLGPRVAAWEIALRNTLCSNNTYYKFSLNGLLRGDHTVRGTFYHNAIMDGWMSINEVREKEDLKPIKNGEKHYFPLNYGNLDDIAAGKFANNGSAWNTESEKKEELSEEEKLIEKRKKDLLFIEEAKRPIKTSRRKLESMIKAQLKKEIAELLSLISSVPSGEVIAKYTEWLNANAKEMQPQYKELYLSVMNKMLPIIQKEINSDIEVASDRIEAYADSYARDFVARHSGYVLSRAKEAINTDTVEKATQNMQQDLPIIESEEEVNRSSNAFSVFFYAALGLEYMHSVASADACSFCRKLNGKIVSVTGYVLAKGSEEDDGDGNIRKIDKNYRHPPYHTHCSCFMAPGR